jgi:hypothetical protein
LLGFVSSDGTHCAISRIFLIGIIHTIPALWIQHPTPRLQSPAGATKRTSPRFSFNSRPPCSPHSPANQQTRRMRL